jgi:type I restriction enzyme, S subunit
MARKSIYPPSVMPGIPRLGGKPEGWVETTFGEVLQVVQRRTEVADDTEYQLVNAKRSRGGVVARERLLGRQVLTKTQFLVRTDDFLISKRQIIHGACGIVPASLDGALVSNEYATLRVRDRLLLDYLRYFIHTVYFQQTCLYASVGVDVEKMIFRLGDWLKYKVHLPPVPEQRKIAAILATWDEAIALTERRIAAGQQRKQGLMQRLLTGQVRFPEFVDEPGIAPPLEQKVPIGWRALKFGNVVSLGSRKFDPQVDPTPLPCVELEHISQGTGVILGSVPANAQRSIKNRFVAGQILFGKLRPYLRKYARPEFDGVCSSEIWVFSANQDICDSSYLFYFVQSEDFISSASISSGTKMPRADWGLVSEAIFALPSIAEQRRIVEALAACDRELDLLARKRDALQRQKRGLMQQLLTGRVRVKE